MVDLCKICGGTTKQSILQIEDYEYRVPGKWAYHYCQSCDLNQLNPFPEDIQIIKDFYPKNYGRYKKTRLFSFLNSVVLRYRVKSLGLSKSMLLKIIDVGSGDCSFLKSIIEEYDVQEAIGIDISYDKKFKRDVITETNVPFIETRFPSQSFDAIIMNNYLEHTLNPLQECMKTFDYLKSGGLFFGVLPNWDSIDRRFFGRYWGGMHVPRHLYQFTPHSLTMLLRNAGFEKIEVRNEIHPGHISIAVSNYLIHKMNLKRTRIPMFTLVTILLLPVSVLLSLFSKNGAMKFRCIKGRT